MRAAGFAFDVVVSTEPEPEKKPAGIPIDAWPMCLAFMKAKWVAHTLGRRGGGEGRKRPAEAAIILAADTIVVEGSRILNKARNRAHARRMLSSLRGKKHRVITGIALFRGDRVRLASAQAVCRVRRLSDAWLERYLDSGLWKGKAGAYGIQDDDPFVELLSGDFSTVVGLPMALVQSELASFRKD